VWLRVKLNQHVAFFHPIVVVDQNTGYLAADPRRDERHIPIHIGVIGRHGVKRTDEARDSDEKKNCGH
jgi:hypothetical protein